MILGILQARASSSRLPGKVLKPLLGVPMLARQIERLQRSTKLINWWSPPATRPGMRPSRPFAPSWASPVLAARWTTCCSVFIWPPNPSVASQIVRLTGDCPLADPALIDELVELHLTGGYDYSSNCWTPATRMDWTPRS